MIDERKLYENWLHQSPDLIISAWDVWQARAALAQPDELFCDTHCTWRDHHPDCFMARTEKGPEPEPVAYLWQHGETGRTRIIEKDQVWTASNQWNRVGPLYLHPPQRKPLTDEEIDAACGPCDDSDLARGFRKEFIRRFRAIYERLHGIGGKP